MPDNVKSALSISIRRLLRPLVSIMLREGFTYSHFASIAQMAFVESAAKDFKPSRGKSSLDSVCGLTGMTPDQVRAVLSEEERFEAGADADLTNPFAKVLHGWHNDRDYVGPYRFPIDLPFDEGPRTFTALVARHAPHVAPNVILQELIRIGAVTEVGDNVWKPLKQEYIEPSMSPEHLRRMAALIESLLSTLEFNTNKARTNSVLFERTLFVDDPLTRAQFDELNAHLKVVGAQFLQRVDSFAALDLKEKASLSPKARADLRAGLQCFLFIEANRDDTRLRDVISDSTN